ncbi:MAG: magnesium transporter, partial [Bacillota bacterium]
MVEELYKELQDKLKRRKLRFNRWLQEKKASDLAEVIFYLNEEELNLFINKSQKSRIAAIIEKADEDIQVLIINNMKLNDIITVFTYISSDEITDILGNIPRDKRKEILKKMKPEKAEVVQKLLEYGEESAGGLMTTEFICFPENYSIKKVLDELEEKIEAKTANLETIFVINEKNKLVGKADLRGILSASEDILLKEITNYNIVTVVPGMDQEEVSLLVAKYDLKVIPVVNKNNNILGLITVDDIIDVIEEEATEDMLMMVGVDKDERVNSSLLTSIRKRLPWLYINLG